MDLEVQIEYTPRLSIESGFVEELSDTNTPHSPRSNSPRPQLPPLLKRLFSAKRPYLARQRATRSTIKKQRTPSGYQLAKAVSDTCLTRRSRKDGRGRRPSVERLDGNETVVVPTDDDVVVVDAGCPGDASRRHSYQPKRSRCLSVAEFEYAGSSRRVGLCRAYSEPSVLASLWPQRGQTITARVRTAGVHVSKADGSTLAGELRTEYGRERNVVANHLDIPVLTN